MMDHLIIPSDAMISFPSAGAKISSKIVLNPLITRSIWTAWRRDFFVALWNEKVDKFNHLKKRKTLEIQKSFPEINAQLTLDL